MSESTARVTREQASQLPEGVTITAKTATSITLHFDTSASPASKSIVEIRRPQTVRTAGLKLTSAA
jgi:hypothetical protein